MAKRYSVQRKFQGIYWISQIPDANVCFNAEAAGSQIHNRVN